MSDGELVLQYYMVWFACSFHIPKKQKSQVLSSDVRRLSSNPCVKKKRVAISVPHTSVQQFCMEVVRHVSAPFEKTQLCYRVQALQLYITLPLTVTKLFTPALVHQCDL